MKCRKTRADRKTYPVQLNLENARDRFLNADQILNSRKIYFNKRNTQETKGSLICFYLGLAQNLPIELRGFKVLRKGDHTEPSCFTVRQQDQVSMTSGPYSSGPYSQMIGPSTAGTSFARGADTGAAFSSTAASFAAANDTSFAPGVGAETTVAAPAPAPPFFL